MVDDGNIFTIDLPAFKHTVYDWQNDWVADLQIGKKSP